MAQVGKVLALLLLCASLAKGDDAYFREQVAPILEAHCVSCHSGAAPKGGLSLETPTAFARGGESGPALVAGKAAESLLIQYVEGEEPLMPKDASPLGQEEVAILREWIDRGAFWPAGRTLVDRKVIDRDWWSLRPLARPAVPAADSAWCRTPIDAFILAKLRDSGLAPSAEGDRRTLLRRVYFDLIGLPPSPDEAEAFLADTDPLAYEKLVDRLLASPRYGERWARHWLDVVHYGDTHGYDKDKIRPNAWPYRDYVIRAFNDDKPYTRFVEEQLAGDILYPDTADGVVATGFIAAGPFDFVGQIEVASGTLAKAITRNLDRDDMVATAIGTFNSMTAHCARCHDHKFDPISQEDYYALQAVFAGIDRADRPFDDDPATARQRRGLTERVRALEDELARAKGAATSAAPAAVAPDVAELGPRPLDLLERELETARAALAALPSPRLVYAAATHFAPEGQFTPTLGMPRPIHLLDRGNEQAPGPKVPPGTCSYLSPSPVRFTDLDPSDEGARRVALARWIVDKQNPLTWRSIVNRIWQYHFGRALVDSPNDFGRMGALPTHPELLDWLAMEFRDGPQSIKSLHRLICTSAVYRQSSLGNEAHEKIDGENQLLWRMNRRKLEAEAVRDSVLAFAAKLDLTAGGPGFRAFGFVDDHSPHYKYNEYDPDDPHSHRRSIYRFIVRSVPDPFMTTLDCADSSAIVPKRTETLTPLQSLAMLNNPFMVRMAQHFAARLERAAPTTPDRITAAWKLAFAREPTASELAAMVEYADRHGLPSACRMIFNLNEFIFID